MALIRQPGPLSIDHPNNFQNSKRPLSMKPIIRIDSKKALIFEMEILAGFEKPP
jgi:hypothetical protein